MTTTSSSSVTALSGYRSETAAAIMAQRIATLEEDRKRAEEEAARRHTTASEQHPDLPSEKIAAAQQSAPASATTPEQTAQRAFADPTQYRAEVIRLRKDEEKHDRAVSLFAAASAQIEAAQAAIKDHATKTAAALARSWHEGKRELPHAERLLLADEERKLFALASDHDMQPDQIEVVRAQLDAEGEQIADRWETLRREGRLVACEIIAADAHHLANELKNPHLELHQVGSRLENLRDHCAAHYAFWNAAEGRTVLGVEHARFGNVGSERVILGIRGLLEDEIDLNKIWAKWAPVAGDNIDREPDQARVTQIITHLRDSLFIQPYTDVERTLEEKTFVSPAGKVQLRAFRTQPERLDPWTWARMQQRVEQIETDTLALSKLQRARF